MLTDGSRPILRISLRWWLAKLSYVNHVPVELAFIDRTLRDSIPHDTGCIEGGGCMRRTLDANEVRQICFVWLARGLFISTMLTFVPAS